MLNLYVVCIQKYKIVHSSSIRVPIGDVSSIDLCAMVLIIVATTQTRHIAVSHMSTNLLLFLSTAFSFCCVYVCSSHVVVM